MTKLTYQSNGYKGYDDQILGYKFRVFETPEGFISYGAPMGDTLEEKEMFDKLVYYNKTLYHGTVKNKEEVRQRIANFISKTKAPLGDPNHDCPNCFKNNPDLPL